MDEAEIAALVAKKRRTIRVGNMIWYPEGDLISDLLAAGYEPGDFSTTSEEMIVIDDPTEENGDA